MTSSHYPQQVSRICFDIQQPSLQHIAMVKICQDIIDTNYLIIICNKKGRQIEEFRQIMRILPEVLKHKFSFVFHSMLWRMKVWRGTLTPCIRNNCHSWKTYDFEKSNCLQYKYTKTAKQILRNVYWTPYGTIDRVKTFTENVDIFSYEEASTVADVLGLKDYYVHVYGTDLTIADSKIVNVVERWIAEKEINERNYYETFLRVVRANSYIAVKYFWNFLSVEQKNRMIAWYMEKPQLRTMNAEIIFFFLAQMTDEQLLEIFESYSCQLLNYMLIGCFSWAMFIDTCRELCQNRYISGSNYINFCIHFLVNKLHNTEQFTHKQWRLKVDEGFYRFTEGSVHVSNDSWQQLNDNIFCERPTNPNYKADKDNLFIEIWANSAAYIETQVDDDIYIFKLLFILSYASHNLKTIRTLLRSKPFFTMIQSIKNKETETLYKQLIVNLNLIDLERFIWILSQDLESIFAQRVQTGMWFLE